MNRPALVFIFLIPILLTLAADPPHPPPPVSCSDELVNFSTCLPFVALPPNNSSDSPSPQCCNDVSAAYKNNSTVCLCYFSRQPHIMGFPINSTKVISLSSLCELDDVNSNALQALCSGHAALPPLQSISGAGSTKSPPLPNNGPSIGPVSSLPTEEEPADKQPTHPTPPAYFIGGASPNQNKQLGWVISFLVYICASARISSFMST